MKGVNKIWYISRTYLPEKTGGALIRIAQVEFFRAQGAKVMVVTPNYEDQESVVFEDEIKLSYQKSTIWVNQIFERLGIYEDYLDQWVLDNFALLKDQVKKEDYIFATSGGELGCIKLGSLLKNALGCKFVVNLHDPVDYTRVSGRKINSLPHISREGQERKYLQNADLIITSSKSNQVSLREKYPALGTRIQNSYFGYVSKAVLREKALATSKLTIVYGGTYDKNQSPEKLAQTVQGMENVEAHFVGSHRDYKPLDLARKNQDNCKFTPQMSYQDFLQYLVEHASMGFVSLGSPYLGACVPSKIYEYINIGLPILGALPMGDAKDIINHQGYGVACDFKDAQALRTAIVEIGADQYLLGKYRQQILLDKHAWYMPLRMAEVYQWMVAL